LDISYDHFIRKSTVGFYFAEAIIGFPPQEQQLDNFSN
jgi:hypothetical protein